MLQVLYLNLDSIYFSGHSKVALELLQLELIEPLSGWSGKILVLGQSILRKGLRLHCNTVLILGGDCPPAPPVPAIIANIIIAIQGNFVWGRTS